MVTSGIFGENTHFDPRLYVRKNEVIDLSDPTVTCKSWIDSPIDLHVHIGAFIGDKMLICGGALDAYEIDNSQDFPELYVKKFHSSFFDKCYAMTPSNVTELSGLIHMKCHFGFTEVHDCAAGVINNSLFVTSGLVPRYYDWNTFEETFEEWQKATGDTPSNGKITEYVTEHSSERGPDIPTFASEECFIGINDTHSMFVGGRYELMKSTRYFNNLSQTWSDGPKLNDNHVGHACGKFKIDGKMVLVVASSRLTYKYPRKFEKPYSVEFLPIDGREWVPGPSLPEATLKGSLPFDIDIPYYISPYIVSNEDNLYFIDTDQNVILRLDCPSDLSSCQWIKMQQKLEFPRRRGVVALIPDSMTSCEKK